MKTLKKVPVTVVEIPVDGRPDWDKMEEGVLYQSKSANYHVCLCGCRQPVVIPYHKDGWVYSLTEGKITIHPSIGNYQFPCQSHYIITNGVANFV